MAGQVVVEFVGGPRDGEVRTMPDLRDRWLFPAPVAAAFVRADDTNMLSAHPVIVYELMRDPQMRKPSLSDAGRYRYEFKGYRS